MSYLTANAANRGQWTGAMASVVVTGITVGSGNNSQALAVALTGEINVIGTSSATASTGVRLPSGVTPGDTVTVHNAGANTTLVYPATGGKVDAGSTNAGFSMATGKKAQFIAVSGTDWVAILSA